MPQRSNSLPLILVVLGIVLIAVICGGTLISLGVITSLFPVRVISAPVDPTEAIQPVPTTIFPFSNLPGIPIQDVRVVTGLGSPIPVEIVASGEWPSSCSQLAETNIRYVDNSQIHVELLTEPAAPDCPPATQGLPFSFRIPLNMVELASGKYSVIVNGVQTDFVWDGALTESQGHFPPPIPASNAGLLPVTIRDARVEVGVGSPIPVEIALAGDWPTLCSQLGQVKTRVDGQKITVELLATPADTTCPKDLVGLTFGLRIPLNMVALPKGNYTVTVNGLQTSFEWPIIGEPQFVDLLPLRTVFIGPDGNIWLVDQTSSDVRLLTSDATALNTASTTLVDYNEPQLSSDGRFIAYRRGIVVNQASGGSMDMGLWVMDIATADPQEIYALSPSGYSWQPGTHLLAYVPELEGPYFTTRGDKPDSTYAKGIMAYDADSGETYELVKPERGYALYGPVWSPDGRFLSFDEVLYMEGRGPFAYYDFVASRYIALDQPLGMYSWSPDGEVLAYDNLTYIATGEERIYLRTRQGGEISDFSADYDPGYAIMPTFSPLGDYIAYLVNTHDPDSQVFTLFVQPYPEGEQKALGEFENVFLLRWAPDGTRLVFSSGAFGAQQINEVNILTGENSQTWQGMQPSVAPIPQD